MPRRLVLCLDGTWNTYKDHTNVSRLHACIPNLPDGNTGDQVQIKYYDEGVGTNAYDRIRGGMFGAGLAKNIRQAYAWLIRNYQEGSELFIFGFSRGAYTARSLAGLIARCGIARRLPNPDADKLAEKAYTIYRSSPKDNTDAEEFRNKKAQTVRIQFLGVWDTVGALGVPTVQFAEKFHDTKLGANVDNAYHAVAIDEHRKAYDVVLWTENPGNANMEQRWFPGAHANIGGGYEDDLLPDLSLKWMLEKACDCGLYLGERNGIALKPDDVLPLDQGEFRSPVRDSYQEFAGGIYSVLTLGQRHYRKIGNHLGERVDASAFRKWEEDPGYRPYNLAHAEPGVLIPAMGAAVATANVSGSHPMADESRETPP
ncbi:MAG: DUF2235 domain-containing protein [Candidatus Competibacteraceae bacterium]|nr:DUF2235 domain-containing protein [Candidatus Competibacteraceae bacterium]